MKIDQILQKPYQQVQHGLGSISSVIDKNHLTACVKSGLYSFTVCVIFVSNDFKSGALSATFSCVACAVYIYTIDFLAITRSQWSTSSQNPSMNKRFAQIELFLLTEVWTTHISKKLGCQASSTSTVVLSFCSFALSTSATNPNKIPVFAVIICSQLRGSK